ncbi:hypothetical protein [Streptomyces sp. NPDC055287]
MVTGAGLMLGGGVLVGAIAPDAATAVAAIGTTTGGIVAFVLRRSSVALEDSAMEADSAASE